MPPGNSNPENFANWANLMGDPGMYLWLGVPATLSVSHAASLTTGQSHLPVTVTSGGQPLADAVVCVTQSSTGFQSRVLTDALGQATVPLAGLGAGTAKLTVSKANCLVYQADLAQTSATAYANVGAPGIGGDGLATPGESVSLLPVLNNTGTSTTLTGVSAVVTVAPEYGTLSDNTLTWPNVAAGGSASASSGCTLVLNAGCAGRHRRAAAGGHHHRPGHVQRPVRGARGGARPVVQQPVLRAGRHPHQPEHDGHMTVSLRNMGGLAASSMSYTLTSSDPFITVIDGSDNSGALPIGGTATPTFTIESLAGSFGGYVAQLEMAWTANGMIQGVMPLSVPIGTGTAETPPAPTTTATASTRTRIPTPNPPCSTGSPWPPPRAAAARPWP
jgi:hypothetical protein